MSIFYHLKRSRRAKRTSITVTHTGEIIVTIPFFGSSYIADRFVQQKKVWIEATQEKIKKRFENKTVLKQSKKEYQEKKSQALDMLIRKVEYYNQFYSFSFKKIQVRNQSSRWGSCSSKGNLNFNYALIYLPAHLSDYIVVHELCHLQEMNHSKKFWNLVEKTMPDYKAHRLELRKKYITIK